MGLVQRLIEEAGITTVSLATIPDSTGSVGVPRLVGIEYPQGQTFGKPGDVEGQTRVLRDTFRALQSIDEPGGRVDLEFEWPERRAQVRTEGRESPPIAKLIKRKPWLLKRYIEGHIPG